MKNSQHFGKTFRDKQLKVHVVTLRDRTLANDNGLRTNNETFTRSLFHVYELIDEFSSIMVYLSNA